jgi:glutathione S-transferase
MRTATRTMKLYHSMHAPNARRVRIFLAEKGIEVALVDIDLAKFDHREERFRAINSFETVPVLELDDGTIIAESIAICRFFEELSPSPSLFGTTMLERAEIEMWQRRAEFFLLLPISQIFRHSHPAMAKLESPQVPDWAASNRVKAIANFARFDAALDGKPFVASGRFSIADVTALVALDFAQRARLAIPHEYKNLHRWRAELAARPSSVP